MISLSYFLHTFVLNEFSLLEVRYPTNRKKYTLVI